MNPVPMDPLSSTVSVTTWRSVYHLRTEGIAKTQKLVAEAALETRGLRGALTVGFSCRFLLSV